jgi:hypothetical protein
MDMWQDELNDEQTESLIEKAANEIRRRKMETPAIMMLEMHKPLGWVASQATLAFSPFLVPFTGFDFMNDYSRLFAKRENIEKLLQKLEAPREIAGDA